MSNSNDSKPEWRPGDSRMADFMHQASQILASERGWNDRSKMLIRSLADDLNLPSYQYDDAVEQLQQGKLDFEDRFSTYEKAFIKYLTRQFEKSQIGVLTAAHEATAIRKARREFEIGQVRARHLIRQVADQLSISRVSKRDAVEYVAAMIDETIANETVVSDAMRGRIFESAMKWGVETNQIEILIQNRIDANRQETRPSKPWLVKGVATLASILILAALGWLGLQVIQQASSKRNPPEIDDANLGLETMQPVPILLASNPDWWSQRTASLFGEFSLNTRFATFPHDLLRSEDATQRVLGYRELVEAFVRSKQGGSKTAQSMFALMFAEEQEPVRRQMASVLREPTEVFVDNLPSNINSWQESWRVLDMLLACQKETLNVRAEMALDENAYQLTGIPIRDPDFSKLCYEGLARRQWQTLQSYSYRQPDRVAQLVDGVSDLTNRRLGFSLGQEHATTMTLLGLRPGTWSRMRSTLQLVVETAGPDQLREIYLANSKFEDPELQRWLATRLAKRLGVKVDQVTAERIDVAIRKKLDLQKIGNTQLKQRWQRFFALPEVKPLLSSEPIEFASPMPQAIADVVHAGTLAVLLYEAEQNPTAQLLATFDELIRQEPRDLSIRTRRLVDGLRTELHLYQQIERRPVPSDVRTFESALARLANPTESTKAKALAFEQLGTVGPRIKKLTQDQAATLARFMLQADSTSELVSIEKHATMLRHWPNLTLKIADMLPDHDCTMDQALTSVSLLLELQPVLDGKKSNWREQLSQQIVQRVAAGLRSTAERGGFDRRFQWDELREFFVDYYRIRCQIIGVDVAKIDAARSPVALAGLFAVRFDEPRSRELAAILATHRFMGNSEVQQLALISGSMLERRADVGTQQEAVSALEQIYQNEILLLRSLAESRIEFAHSEGGN